MSISQKITADLKEAMKAKDDRRISCLMDIKPISKNYRAEKEILLHHPEGERSL